MGLRLTFNVPIIISRSVLNTWFTTILIVAHIHCFLSGSILYIFRLLFGIVDLELGLCVVQAFCNCFGLMSVVPIYLLKMLSSRLSKTCEHLSLFFLILLKSFPITIRHVSDVKPREQRFFRHQPQLHTASNQYGQTALFQAMPCHSILLHVVSV